MEPKQLSVAERRLAVQAKLHRIDELEATMDRPFLLCELVQRGLFPGEGWPLIGVLPAKVRQGTLVAWRRHTGGVRLSRWSLGHRTMTGRTTVCGLQIPPPETHTRISDIRGLMPCQACHTKQQIAEILMEASEP